MKIKLTFIFQFVAFAFSFAQADSVTNYPKIKVRKPTDSVYIKTSTDFYVYYNAPSAELSYRDFVIRNIQQSTKLQNSERIKITYAQPKSDAATAFDYTSYFMNNKIIKEIKLRSEEKDTVQLLINVDSKGKVNYIDLKRVEQLRDTTVVFSKNGKEYKPASLHEKTKKAMDELIVAGWQPAEIQTLKKHPAKLKNKYTIQKAYMQGVLSIYYSASEE